MQNELAPVRLPDNRKELRQAAHANLHNNKWMRNHELRIITLLEHCRMQLCSTRKEVIIKLLSNYVKRFKIILNNFLEHLTQIEDEKVKRVIETSDNEHPTSYGICKCKQCLLDYKDESQHNSLE